MIPVLTLLRGTRQRNFCIEIQNRASFVVVNTYLRKTDVKRGVPSAFGGRNHFAKACRKANVKQVETSSRYSNSDDSDVDYIISITTSVVSVVNVLALTDTPFTKETFTFMEMANRQVKF